MFDQSQTEILDQAHAALPELCGQLNAVWAQITRVIADVEERDSWGLTGCKTLKQWVEWTCGLSSTHAAELIAVARRRDELPETVRRLDAGILSPDQAATIAKHAPEDIGPDAERHFAEFAEMATVNQLRTALRIANRSRPPKEEDSEPTPEERPPSMWFGFDEDGRWVCKVNAPGASAAAVDVALRAAKDSLYQEWKCARDEAGTAPGDGPPPPTNFDALLRMAELSTSVEAVERPHFARTRTIIHVDADSDAAHLHLGPALSAAERALLTCDSTWEVWLERHGVPIGIGRTSRKIPDRLRIAVEERDDGVCAAPWCRSRVGLHLHHLERWRDGGPTESWNLLPLCSHDHHRIHAGELSVTGNPDTPGDLVWRNRHGTVIDGGSVARPPNRSPPPATYTHPLGERADWYWYTPPAWN